MPRPRSISPVTSPAPVAASPETYASLVSSIEGLVADARTGLAAAMNAIMLQPIGERAGTSWNTNSAGPTAPPTGRAC